MEIIFWFYFWSVGFIYVSMINRIYLTQLNILFCSVTSSASLFKKNDIYFEQE